MNAMLNVMRRELAGYFSTPVAWVFIVIFLVMSGVFTFYIGNFYERGSSDLDPFFQFHPWLYLFLIPSISMRLWAEDKKSRTFELYVTLPLRAGQLVVGKYLAALALYALFLAGTGVAAFGLMQAGEVRQDIDAYNRSTTRTVSQRDELLSVFKGTGRQAASKVLDELIDAPLDLVIICTPTPNHPEATAQAARAGKHVLCEKPLAPTPAPSQVAAGAPKTLIDSDSDAEGVRLGRRRRIMTANFY